jgi:hypothetical protein
MLDGKTGAPGDFSPGASCFGIVENIFEVVLKRDIKPLQMVVLSRF